MQENDPSAGVFEDIGRLDSETTSLQEEFENCDNKEEAVVGFLGILGKVLRHIFDI